MTAIPGRLATNSGKTVTWEQALAPRFDLQESIANWNDASPINPDDDGSYAVAVLGVTQFTGRC